MLPFHPKQAGAICFVLLIAAPLVAANQPASDCAKLGEIFGVDPIARTILIKDAEGYIGLVDYDDRTNFSTAAMPPSTDAREITVVQVQSGDYACVTRRKDQKVAERLTIVPRIEIEKAQRVYLLAWLKSKVFGRVEKIDVVGNSMSVRDDGNGQIRNVRLGPDSVIRQYGSEGLNLLAAAPLQLSQLKIGEFVDARGSIDGATGDIVARAVVAGGGRSVAGTLLSIDLLEQRLLIRELGSGKRLSVRVPADHLFRTLGPVEPAQRDGLLMTRYRVRSLGFADLQPGDSVLVVGRPASDADAFAADLLVARFGYFVKPGASSAGAAELWMLH